MTDNEVSQIVALNAERHKERNKAYNPVTGLGGTSPRKALHVSDFPMRTLYIPTAMWENEPVVGQLAQAGSVQALLSSGGSVPSAETCWRFIADFCELRCQYDFEYCAFVKLKIRDKERGTLIPFRLNRGQRKLLALLEQMRTENVPIRIILLKARQWGGSTLIQMYFFWLQVYVREGLSSAICAHVQDASRNILSMYRTAAENLPVSAWGKKVELTPKDGMANARNVVGRECSITVGSAIKPEAIRSQSVHLVHFSEVALFPNTDNNSPEELVASVSSIVPNTAYSAIIYESTAKGVGNFFHTQWLRAKQGKTAFRPLFIPWFDIDLYQAPVGDAVTFVRSMTPSELSLWEQGATLEAICWYRAKLRELDNTDMMMQEFPSNDIEAFRFSGETVFDPVKLEILRRDCIAPRACGELISTTCTIADMRRDLSQRGMILSNLAFEPKRKGKLAVWEYPDQSDRKTHLRYIVSVDAGGRSASSDYSCICVLDRYWMQFGEQSAVVAEWHGHTDLDILAWNAAQIAQWYNHALLVFESNTFESREDLFNKDGDNSEFIFSEIARYYDNLYSRTPKDKLVEGVPPRYGFHTNRATKTMLVSNYIATLREVGNAGGGYIERSEETINEALIYEKRKDGSFGNIVGKGNHDDRIMTRMIALLISQEIPLPYKDKPVDLPFDYSQTNYGSV